MGIYTEFIFQGQTKANLPHEIKELIDYFFGNCSELYIFQLGSNRKLPDHPFFKCDRWNQIGHMGSYYFSPFALRHKENHILNDGKERVFLICNLKNYHHEIQLFLDWINPYMEFYWGYHCYEGNENPVFFRHNR